MRQQAASFTLRRLSSSSSSSFPNFNLVVFKSTTINLNPVPVCVANIHNSNNNHSQNQSRFMGTGPRGARGHGWFDKYRSGEGGRHLQGKYNTRNVEKLVSINNEVFSLNNANNTDKNSTTSSVVPKEAFLDFVIEGEDEGKEGSRTNPHRVIIELASTALPNTCRNFIDLCTTTDTTESDGNDESGFKSSKVFKILPNLGLCIGKDNNNIIPTKNGKSFPHEATVLSHAQTGIVSMLNNKGTLQNDSRFMIMTTEDAPHLDGKHVAFGRVKVGLEKLQGLVESVYTRKGKPSIDIQIVSCGLV
mmetsp:Transcript_457/g.642  ORF Transcript_457/g.642 Transcript_457/m.642 type:complete len:304 (+) Transcript_457:122-1033(+)